MIRCPNWLEGEAKEYWHRHAKRLQDDGILTDKDVDSFAMHCDLWRLLRATDPLNDPKEALRYCGLRKIFDNGCKQFGLVPKDRKRSGLEKQESINDVFRKVRE